MDYTKSNVIDGKDIINIHINSITKVGRLLDKATCLPFEHSVFGRFKTIDGLWHYIASEEHSDIFRNLTGRNVGLAGKKITKKYVKNFKAMILDSTYQKIMYNNTLLDLVKKSELPFTCWYYFGENNIRIHQPFNSWLLPGIEMLRRSVKSGLNPDYTDWLDDISGYTSESNKLIYTSLISELN